MPSRTKTILLPAVAALFFGFTLLHASWLADEPQGKPKLIADHGVDPVRDTAGCIAEANAGYGAAAVGPDIAALQGAIGAKADAVHVTTEFAGGVLVLARQYKSDCAVDNVRPQSSLAETTAALSRPEIFWQIKDEKDARQLIAELPLPEVDVPDRHFIIGSESAVKFIQNLRPSHRAFSIVGARNCTADYQQSGLWGSVPASCQGGTMLLTLDDLGYTLWGWPNRYLERMKDAGVRVIIAESVVDGKIKGLSNVTQYGDIADSFNGHIWVDNITDLGPALKR